MKNGGSFMQNAAAIVYTSCCEIMHNNCTGALQKVVFRPIIDWVNEALDSAGISDRCYVVNSGENDVLKHTGENPAFVDMVFHALLSLTDEQWNEIESIRATKQNTSYK